MTIIISIWIIASLIAIYITDTYYYWEDLFKIFIIFAAIAFIVNNWKLYDPTQASLAVTIEINQTWMEAIGVSLIQSVCITGPIAAVHSLIQYKRRG